MRWAPFAMVRVVAFFVVGILLNLAVPDILSVANLTVFLIILLPFYFLARILLRTSGTLKIVSGIIGLTSILLAGYLNVSLNNQAKRDNHILNIKQEIHAYTVKLVSSPEEKARSWKQRGAVQAVRTETGWNKAAGLVNLYLSKTNFSSTWSPGDVLLVKGHPNEVEPPRNPDQFDLRRFLKSKNIFHQHFIPGNDWKLLHHSDEGGVLLYAHQARAWSIAAIKKFITTPQEQGIVIALVLGVTDGIDNDLQGAYAASGAMHVLAVSGLHVSIIYGILLFFLKPLNRGVYGRWIVALLSLLVLWSYAFLTGLSPSVLRAVTMFSFVVLAKPLGETTNIYNTLAASAFLLLLYDPLLILSVGFQLSYLAVLGIVYLQRPLYNLLEAPALFDWAWQLSCVTIAAQVATIALGLFYFHQFPVYFLLANLFVIPGSFVVLVGGILLIIISPLTLPASWLGFLLGGFVKVLNLGIFWVEKLPGSLVDGIYISPTQCFLLLLAILFSTLLFQLRKFRFLILAFGCAVAFSALSWNRLIKARPGFIVYHVPNHSALMWFETGQAIFVSDSTLTETAFDFNIESHWVTHGITRQSVVMNPTFREVSGMKFLKWRDKTFLWIRSGTPFINPAFKGHLSSKPLLTADYVIVSNNGVRSFPALASVVAFKHLVFDTSNSPWYCEKMSRETVGLAGRCYLVLKDGAFTVTL